MVAQPVCNYCGKPVGGRYVTALNAVWHPEHFLCAACHLPIDTPSFTIYEGKPYHSTCYIERVLPRCVYCNAPLTEAYLVDHWGNKFCKKHQQEYPTCEFCGRLIPPAQQEHSAGKPNSVRCPICRARAIETSEQARSLFAAVKRWVGSQGLTYNNLPLSLRLCDRNFLAQFAHTRSQPHMLGVTMSTTHTLNGRETRTDIDGVAVLQGLPTPLFEGIVIHELGHVWLIAHTIYELPQWAEEGFCELLTYRYYTQLNTPESLYHAGSIENNPDPVYGEGFRRVRAIADRVGFPRLVETLNTTKRLPA
jgi:LIM domain/Protein DA1